MTMNSTRILTLTNAHGTGRTSRRDSVRAMKIPGMRPQVSGRVPSGLLLANRNMIDSTGNGVMLSL